MTERDAIGIAIGKAKVTMDFNLDAAVDANKSRRTLLTTLQRMAGRKSTHEIQKGEGKGYVFNKDGNQTIILPLLKRGDTFGTRKGQG